jgi:hypothetical protein
MKMGFVIVLSPPLRIMDTKKAEADVRGIAR